jgi:hypothetical protein
MVLNASKDANLFEGGCMTKRLMQFLVTGLTIVLLAGSSASALEIDGPRDCDNNAIIHCGSLSTRELKRDYAGDVYAQKVFRSFGITSVDIQNIGETAVSGHVSKDGEVFVGSKPSPVAKNAVTAGRLDMPGSTAVTTAGGATYYKRPPSVSFQQESLTAFVVMKDGVFQYAILGSCGNPVSATPVVKKQAPAEQPAPAPVVPEKSVTPTPVEDEEQSQAQAQSQTQSQTEKQSQSQSQQVVINQAAAPVPPTPAPAPVVHQVVASAPEQPVGKQESLPNVGIAGGTSLFLLSSLMGTVAFRRWLVNQ